MLQVVKGTYIDGRIVFDENPGIKDTKKVIVTFLDEKVYEKTAATHKNKIVFGSLKGKISVPDDFDEPLDDLKEYME